MPKPTEICEVTAFGERYNNWKTVEVMRSIDNEFITHAMLTVAEISTNAKTLSDLKLKPGDPVTVTLAGRRALDGFVYQRQAVADGYQHGVQIGIASKSQHVVASTVDTKPGQYINQTLQQIGSATFGKVGVNFKVICDASRPFKRVSEHFGETRFAFVERLCRMRNVHLMDSAEGIVGFRGAQSGGLVVREGFNMVRGRVLLQTWDQADPVIVGGMDHNNDSADANRATEGIARIPGFNRPMRVMAEESGSDQDMQDRANHEKDWILLKMVDGELTVPGWLVDSGSLWMEHIGQTVTLESPLLLPHNTMQFMIKGVVHRQSSEGGTTTDVLLCDVEGMGAGGHEPLRMGNG